MSLLSSSPRRVAVVTGGARGIGLAIAKWLLAREYRVALWDIDVQALEQTAAEFADESRVLAIPARGMKTTGCRGRAQRLSGMEQTVSTASPHTRR